MSVQHDMRSLAELQRDFQRHVMHGDDRIVAAIDGSPTVPATLRLAIYSEAYRLRLTDALASTLPRLQQLMGEEAFAAVAREYIDLYPSRYPSIRWFGDQLPHLLRNSFPEQPWFAELATWEWSIAAAFDGADADSLGVEALASIAPERWPALTFQFHPTVQILPMRTNAPVIFKALSADDPPPEGVVLDAALSWLIWREGLKTQYRSLAPDELAALELMRGGGSFEMLCDALCAWHDAAAVPAQAAGLLKRWVVEQMIVGVS
jgi:hypothetical protein